MAKEYKSDFFAFAHITPVLHHSITLFSYMVNATNCR